MSDSESLPPNLAEAVIVLQCAVAILISRLPSNLRDVVLAEIESGLITAGGRVGPDTIEYGSKFVAEIRRSLDSSGD